MGSGFANAALGDSNGAFERLSVHERRTLAQWVDTAQAGGIEGAQDLGARLGLQCGSETVIGVFKSGHMLASWLVVGNDGAWAVASCGDGEVSQRLPSLADALRLVYPRRSTKSARPLIRQRRPDDMPEQRSRCSA